MAILLIFYKLLLEKENMHVLKRFYLLGAIIASFLIPSIVFIDYVELPVSSIPIVNTLNQNTLLVTENVPNFNKANIPLVFTTIYIAGVLLFGFRFCKNLIQILKRITNNTKLQTGAFFRVLLLEDITPHTFFSYIFLNKTRFESSAIPKEVLLHEETHAKQYHSIDVLFIEFLQVFMWFNPLIYQYNKTIKLNHEFLADSAVLKKDIKTTSYQNTLLSYLSPDSKKKYQPTLANAINYSSIKKRFTVMKKQTSKKSIILRSTLIIPLLALLFYSFSERQIVEKESANTNLSILQHSPQEGATAEEILEYNTLAKKYNAITKSGHIIIKKKEVDRMSYLYSIMTKKERKNTEPYPTIPPMPEPPTTPKVKKGEISNIPPPPAPKSPLDHVIEMAKKDAGFYYEGNKISSDRAIELVKTNKNLNIDSRRSNTGKPTVKISIKPIHIK